MNELDLISLWTKTRWHIIVSQLATAGVLLASGILGAVAQVSAANEGLTIIEDLKAETCP